jgi:hypothetical protein
MTEPVGAVEIAAAEREEMRRDSKGLIACRGGQGVVLQFTGGDIESEILEGGLSELGDLGLDDAPEGLSIWEGRYVYDPRPSLDGDYGDGQPSGKFRPLTPQEWAKLAEGKQLWPPNERELPF